MQYLDKLKNRYNPGEPILLSELTSGKDKREQTRIRVALSRYAQKGLIKKAQRGVYYLPYKTILGEGTLSNRDIYTAKYLEKAGKIIGIYTGGTAENILGLTTQVPAVPEILTNNTTYKKKYLQYGKTRFIIYRSIIKIDETNQKEVQLMDYLYRTSVNNIKAQKESLREAIKRQNIDKNYIIRNISKYPIILFKKLSEGEVLDVFYN